MSYDVRLDGLESPVGAPSRREKRGETSRHGAERPTKVYQPRQLGRYRLCLKVAAGGMANVYLACVDGPNENGGLRPVVALKVLHPNLTSDSQFVDMFFDEARIGSLIHHPFVCGVLDFGAAEGTPDKHAARVARVLADACEGLHAAHELCDPSGRSLELVHRDVAPDNLLVTYDGVVKVVDFGVAKLAHGRHRTRTGIIKGKMEYIAPELLRGDRADRRADVWGLGTVLWEMLTLRRLFHRPTDVATLGAILGGEIIAPSKIRPGLPEALDDIVLRALARAPEERYANARDLGRDLTQFLVAGGQTADHAELADWMERIFPGGSSVRQHLLQVALRPGSEEVVSRVHQSNWPGLVSWGSRQLSSRTSVPPKSPQSLKALVVAAAVVALGALAVVAGMFLGRRSLAPSTVKPSSQPLAPLPSFQAAAPLDPRQALVLELAATRESGERHTLLRFRTAPDGEVIIDEATSAASRDAPATRDATAPVAARR